MFQKTKQFIKKKVGTEDSVVESSDQYWMKCAVNLAAKIKSEVPIAALIIKDNKLVSKAINGMEKFNDATCHAEIVAIRKASKALKSWRLNGCTLYSTLEPCPMCTGAVINSRISKVVFGAYDLNSGACGSVVNLIKDLNKEKNIEIAGGILEFESSLRLKQFFAVKRKK